MPAQPDDLTPPERLFAAKVRELREERGWSQSELAGRIRSFGLDYVNQTTVSRIEKLARPVRMIEAQAISSIYGRTVASMMRESRLDTVLARAARKIEEADQVAQDAARAAQAVAEIQAKLSMELYLLRRVTPSTADQDAETIQRQGALIEQLERFVQMDFAATVARVMTDTRAAMRIGSYNRHGEHPEAS